MPTSLSGGMSGERGARFLGGELAIRHDGDRETLAAPGHAARMLQDERPSASGERAFDALGADPVAASLKLNESVNFLTVELYRQIKALQDQGKVTDATLREGTTDHWGPRAFSSGFPRPITAVRWLTDPASVTKPATSWWFLDKPLVLAPGETLQIRFSDAQIASLRAMLSLMQQELDMNQPLLAQGDVSRADILRMQRSVSDINAQIVNVRNKYLQDLQAEYTRTEEELVAAREILAQRTDMLNDTEIRAPTDGIVKNVRLTTIGGVLPPIATAP